MAKSTSDAFQSKMHFCLTGRAPTGSSTVLGVRPISAKLPRAPLVLVRELDLPGDALVRQSLLQVVALPLAVVRVIMVVSHPDVRLSIAGEVVLVLVETRPTIQQISA